MVENRTKLTGKIESAFLPQAKTLHKMISNTSTSDTSAHFPILYLQFKE